MAGHSEERHACGRDAQESIDDGAWVRAGAV
jgi:hypothetical protein